ncbi:MAG: single-stranded-DNA-specific exonuclease RecJ [Polyangiaceae bacterium]
MTPSPGTDVPDDAPERAASFVRDLGVTETTARVLSARGFRARESVERFFEPKLAGLTPPEGMLDRDRAVERLARAVKAGERVAVFGDYDADGITSAAILTDVLRTLGGEVVTLLADRWNGGYGFSDEALARVLESGATLLVTCDCGSSDHERIARAAAKGVDVVVIDHHRVPPDPLPALAFLNPHRPECGFPYKGLASCGLALSVAGGVRTALDKPLDLRAWLDLVALGTIADVAPLDGDNRALVRAGLALLREPKRPGVRALADVAGATRGAVVTGEDVAFRFAPRINAPGRLERPDLALALLLAPTEAEAKRIAAEVDAISEKRKLLDRGLLAEALGMLEDPGLASAPAIVLGREGWHQGVVGIVAGKLASRFGKPTIVVGFDGATGRGSVRGPSGFPLYDALSDSREFLLGFGGHQAAAGVHVARASFDAFRDAFHAAVLARSRDVRPVAKRDVDAVLSASDDPARVVLELARFEPCGQGNPAPKVRIEGATIREAREVRGGHLSLSFRFGGRSLRAFGYEMGALAKSVVDGTTMDGTLRFDSYRGGGAVEMRLDSVGVPG